MAAAGDITVVENNALSTAAGRLLVSTDASKQTIRLTSNGAAFTVAQSFGNATDDLHLIAANGSIVVSNAAAVISADLLSLQSGSNGDIGSLANPLRSSATTIQFMAGGNGQVQISESNTVTVSGSSVSGNIRVVSGDTLTVGGNISTSGNISLETLSNNIEGVNVGTPTISANTLNLQSPGSIIFNNLAINVITGISFSNLAALGNITVAGDFFITAASGPITQIAGTSLNVGGLFSINAPGQNVTLDQAGNQFGSIQATGSNLFVREFDSTLLNQINLTGMLEIVSGGDINQIDRIRAATLRLSSGAAITLTNIANEVLELGDVVRGGGFRFFNSLALSLNGLLTTGDLSSGIEIITQNDLVLQNGALLTVNGPGSELILGSRNGQFKNLSLLTPLTLGTTNRFLIYSGTEVETTLGSITATFTQFGTPYPQPAIGSGNGLLLRETRGLGPVVVVNPIIPTGGLISTNVGDFGLRAIELDFNASRFGRFGENGDFPGYR
ncbi:MAG: hypothetical protein HC904_12470 [Blastochloris sp.]|nr:hypothetical protein [Blastochloris sp.]